ncbi:AGE family epimerase/isomerase, partial [Klebsiella pneumoniae]|uniref:AGE family epimerase/isomerase n=1 Tax=Klebsiella pneumoniae TaxID=573 RepID=UPI001E332D6B
YDEQIGAYREEFDREWNEQPNEMLSGSGVVADITMNTHIHVLEAYTTLYRIWPDPQVRQSLDRLLSILHDRMFDPELGRLNVFFDKNWASLTDVTSFGHDIEASWLIQDAIEAAELSNPNYKQMVLA